MPSGIIQLLNTTNAPSVNTDRLYNLNNALHFSGSKVITAGNIVAGTGINVNESNGTITLSTTTSPHSSVGSFFQLPIFVLNSPTTVYQFMNINSSSYNSDYITYIVPQTMTLKNITIISNDSTDQYIVKISNLNASTISENTVSMSSSTEIKQTLNATIDFTAGHKMTVEIKNSSGTSTSEEVLVILDADLVQTSIWTYDTNKTYYTGGNVGIGTTDPQFSLHINSSLTTYFQSGYFFSEPNPTGISSTFIKFEKGIGYGGFIGGYLFQTVGSGLTFGTTNGGNINHHQMVLNSAGYLGIGTTNPRSAFHVIGLKTTDNTLARGIHMGEDGVDGNNGIEINQGNGTAGYIDFSTTSSSDFDGRILYEHTGNNMQFWTNYNFAMIINSSGNTGIGVTNPQYPLHVKTGITGNGTNWRWMANSNTFTYGTSINWSIYTTGGMMAHQGYEIGSDSRIKTNIEELVDNEALIKFRQLKPCRYNYIDNITRTSDKVYGFIAQEVKQIMPYASNILPSNEFIPNVFKFALYNNNIITFDTEHNLESYGNIKLILTSNKEITVPYTVADTLKIHIDTSNLSDDEKPSNHLVQDEDGNDLAYNIFVYGASVDDFHTLNKDAIWTTAAAALQEVDRIQQADAVKIQTLETKNTELENKVSILETELQTEKTKVTNLETQLQDILTRLTNLENN